MARARARAAVLTAGARPPRADPARAARSSLAARPSAVSIAVATVVIVAIATVLVWPFGEYAIDDDWGYVRSLQLLHRDGVLRILDLYQVSLVAHLFWGLLFTTLLGFSFTVTKLSVIVLFAIECLVVLALLDRFGVRRRLLWLAMLTLVFDPLHFYHAFLFNTDVPAITWQLVALLCWVHALDEDDGGYRQATALVLGSLFGALSFLVRQPGLLVHVALLAYLVLCDRRRLRSPWFVLHAFAPAVIVAATFMYWYQFVHGPTRVFTYSQGELVQFFSHFDPGATARTAFAIAIYVGLFVLPLSVVTAAEHAVAVRRSRPGTATVVIALAIAAMLAYVAVVDGQTFPYLRNKITRFGYLRPNEVVLGERDVLWGAAVAWAASIACALSFVAFVHVLANGRAERARAGRAGDPARLVVAFFVLEAAYLLASTRILFDRHLLVLCPTAVILLTIAAERSLPATAEGLPSRRRATAAFAVLLLPLAWYSIAGTHDVHAFSRAAFRAGEALIAQGVPAERIDAGYAFDGWHVYDDATHDALRPRLGSRDAWWIWNLFPSIRTDYVVALSPTVDRAKLEREITQPDRGVFLTPDLAGRTVLRSEPYFNFWPPGEKQVYVLVNESGRTGKTGAAVP